jgi:hypothetical protein
MNLSKSIDFLLENAGPVIQYRLRKEILNNLATTEEENLLEQIYQTPYFKLVESYAKPNGFIGHGIHGHSNIQGRIHETPLQDGETAARLLACYAIPKTHPLAAGFLTALRNDEILQYEIAYNKTNQAAFDKRYVEIASGNGWLLPVYTMMTLLGHGDSMDLRQFLDVCLNSFASILSLPHFDNIMEFNPKLKKKYNYPFITVEKYYPCVYHLTALAHTQSWRTPKTVQTLTNAVNHICEIMPEGTENNTIQIKTKDGPGGGLWPIIQPFTPFNVNADEFDVTMGRKLLTELAMAGVGGKADVINKSAENIEEALSADGVLRLKFSSDAKKKASYRTRWPGAYGEIFLEPDYRKKTAHDCDITFWAVQVLHLVNEVNKSTE